MLLLRIYGIVQGVGFRPFVWRMAKETGIKGYVMNKGGFVEIGAEGIEGDLSRFVHLIENKLPDNAAIDKMEVGRSEDKGFHEFTISPSEETDFNIVSGIPADLATCKNCLRELDDPSDRRYRYPFINCTDCGPRFTIVTSTPYDRVKTSISRFRMCDDCEREYNDPSDRRYHAEPIACPNNGPRYWLSTPDGDVCMDPVKMSSNLLEEGNILAIKGLGGFHIACDATDTDVVNGLRRKLGRMNQPFAIMGRDIGALEEDLYVDEASRELLSSPACPIVVLRRVGDSTLSGSLAPGLNTIGALVPYAPVHHLLFSGMKLPCLVMTSANYPGNPMIKQLPVAREKLPFIEYFLTNDLEIVNRCDDSVIRDGKFIRRSRGYVPVPLDCPNIHTSVAFGAEMNNVVSVSKGGRSMLSQHIGNTSNWDVMESAVESIEFLMRISNICFDDIEFLFCDKHPQYNTSLVAAEWADEHDIDLVRVQHHVAHSFAISAEYGIDEILCIACDGTGYGDDGHNWGGELFHTNRDPDFTSRLGHLEYLKMPGGDLSTRHPLRMLIHILGEEAMRGYSGYFNKGLDEILSIKRMTEKRSHLTSSTGRVLDAVCAMLEVSTKRTFDGEGPMKLESLASKGDDLGIRIDVEDGIIMTSEFIRELYGAMGTHSKQDIARTAHVALGNAFLSLIEENRDLNLPIGFSGGVAINGILSDVLRRGVESMGLRFLEHRKVPPGDGGISYGQSCIDI